MPCLNGGSCSENNSTYACSCAPGWTGNRCQHGKIIHIVLFFQETSSPDLSYVFMTEEVKNPVGITLNITE